jgi:shikimate kinase
LQFLPAASKIGTLSAILEKYDMKNIVLTGFMGTGKTAVGRELARILNMKFIDIDHEIEQAEAMPVKDVFSSRGEAYFREVEARMIQKFSAARRVIIATGGGAVLREENLAALREHGVIFCLTARPETICERTGRNDDRPLLQGDDRMQNIRELLSRRSPFYENAGIMVATDNKTPLQIAEEIIGLVS